MKSADRPIVVFDSGVGGISVLRSLVRYLPRERFVYFGDSANAPYGTRTTADIRRLTLENLRRLDEEYHFKAAVIACNTATSAAITELRAVYADRPIVGIEPALKLAAERHPGKTVVVMATQTTLRERKFAALTSRYADRCRIVRLPCPELVEFVERGELDSPALASFLRDRLGPYCTEDLGAVVLGCTHFPFVRPPLLSILPETAELLDGSDGTARQTRRLLQQRGELRTEGEGSVLLCNSSEDPRMLELSNLLMTDLPLQPGGAK